MHIYKNCIVFIFKSNEKNNERVCIIKDRRYRCEEIQNEKGKYS